MQKPTKLWVDPISKLATSYLVCILVLQCFAGCQATRENTGLDATLRQLENKLANTSVDPINEGGIYREVVAACVLDYCRRYGSLATLNDPRVVQQLAQRKSAAVNFKAVALMLTGLSDINPSPDRLYNLSILEQYSRAAVAGREQSYNFLSKWGMLDGIDVGARKGS